MALKSGLRFFVSASEVPFFGTRKWALTAKVPVFTCKKMALRMPYQKNGDHFIMPTSPQNGDLHVCFINLALLGGFYSDFEIWFFYVPFPPLK